MRTSSHPDVEMIGLTSVSEPLPVPHAALALSWSSTAGGPSSASGEYGRSSANCSAHGSSSTCQVEPKSDELNINSRSASAGGDAGQICDGATVNTWTTVYARSSRSKTIWALYSPPALS